MNKLFAFTLSLLALPLISCSGGGGSDGGSSGSGVSGKTWDTTAFVTQDSCGERIANVRQKFTIGNSGGSLVVDTGIFNAPAQSSGDSTTFGYQEANGDCTRTYTGEISETSSGSADVTLVAHTDCGTVVCESTWTGTATRAG